MLERLRGHEASGPPKEATYNVTPETSDLRLQAVTRLEAPPHRRQAHDQEEDRHAEAQGDAHVGDAVEAPAEAADQVHDGVEQGDRLPEDRKSTRLNSSHANISYAVFCLKKKKNKLITH